MNLVKKRMTLEMALFFILIALVALGNGLSDSIYANYFREVYNITALQRGFIEFPRELPGLLCAAVIAALSSLGDVRTGLIAQILACLGLTVLGLYTPVFGVMLIFLFTNSMGMHLFMPLQDAIGMSLAEPGQVGRRMGQYASVRAAVGFAAGLLVFFGFRTGFFTFRTPVKIFFLIGAAAFALAAVLAMMIIRHVRPAKLPRKKFRLVLRKQYRFYYFLAVLQGVQKQIAYVYGSWVIVSLLAKGADVMALLTIVSAFLSIFFMNMLGKWMDRFGIKSMMYFDALTFIGVYVLYGFVVWGISKQLLPSAGWSVMIVYALFVMDRLSMQIGVVKSIYLRSIAWTDEHVTETLSTGISLDHIVSIVAAALGGFVWALWGPQWVFFMAAFFSLGNLFVAYRVQPEKEQALAARMRAKASPGTSSESINCN